MQSQGLRHHAAANQQMQQAGGQLGAGNGFGQDPLGANAEDRKVSTSDIQLVQNLIERCMQLYMSQVQPYVCCLSNLFTPFQLHCMHRFLELALMAMKLHPTIILSPLTSCRP